jgi:uncharacterized protein (TIGR03083 family)
MTGDARTDQALRLVRAESDRLGAELEALAPADWDRTTNCEWTVRQLVAHLVRQVDAYLLTVHQALSGEPGAPESREARTQRMNRIAAQEPAAILADFRATADRFEREFGALSPEHLEVLGPHSTGPRPARWFVEQRLAEVAFHSWDLHHSLGRPGDLDPATAAFLLPMLVEQNFPAIVARDRTGGEGRFRLAVRGEAGPAWLLDFAPGAVTVTRDARASSPVTIEGDAAALGLLVYGRRSLAELERAGRLSVSGDREAAGRFNELFRGP